MPGTDFVLIQAHFSFRFFKTLLDRPARAKSLHHLFQRGTRGSKNQHISHLRKIGSLVQASSDQQPALPSTDLWSSKFDARPYKKARPFASCACAQGLPILSLQITGYLINSPMGPLHLYIFFAGYCAPRRDAPPRSSADQTADPLGVCRSDLNSLPARGQQIGLFQAGGNFDSRLVRACGTDDAQRNTVHLVDHCADLIARL
jgi:hypothetical protein